MLLLGSVTRSMDRVLETKANLHAFRPGFYRNYFSHRDILFLGGQRPRSDKEGLCRV